MPVLTQMAMMAKESIRFAWAFVLTISGLLGVIGAGPALAADEASDAAVVEQRWIPSVSFFSMGHADKRSARMSADNVSVVRDAADLLDQDGHSIGLPWSFGGTVDIATPVILDLPGRPRLFAHADVGYTYDLEDPVATVGNPGDQPVLPLGQANRIAILNQGASVRAEAKPLVFSGGVGTVFSFEAFDRGFRLRPTLEWMYRRDTMKNALGSGESEGPTDDCTFDCRTLFIRSQTEKGYHSLGPGMELEADVGRAGDFLVGFYGSFRAFYLVGDRKANLRSTGSWRRLDNQPTTRADSTLITRYEREPWHYRFGFGLRLLWSPEE